MFSKLLTVAAVALVLSVASLVVADKIAPLQSGDQVMALVCSKFGSKAAAAGIMGNIAVESAYTYNYQIHQQGGGNGYGLFQFDFLKSYYFSWLSSTGLSDSAASQVDFVYQTIYGNQQYLIGAGRAQELQSGLSNGSPQNTCTSFCNIWEQPGVPHLGTRIQYAQQWFDTGCP